MRGLQDIEETVLLDSGLYGYLLMRYKSGLSACIGTYTLFPWITAASHGWRAAHPDLALFFLSVVSREDVQMLLSPEDPLIVNTRGGGGGV